MPPRQRLVLILLVFITALLLALLTSLLAQPEPSTPTDVAVMPGLYLAAPHVQWLALAALAPLALALAFAWRHERPVLEYLQPEMYGAFGVWITLANAYAVAFMLPILRLLPPAADSGAGNQPVNWLALGLIFGTMLFYIWFLFVRQRGLGGMADRIYLPHRRVALLLLLIGLVGGVWVLGGLGFALLVIPPAWLWIHIDANDAMWAKLVNVVLAAGGIAPFTIVLAGFNPWQLVLAAAYGVFHAFDVLMFLLLAALFVRFLRLGFSIPYKAPPPLPSQSEILKHLLQ